MTKSEMDEVDRGILHLLQEDARANSAADIAEVVGVTANTVRNRINRLQDRGVIRSFVPILDYEQAGYQLTVVIICTASVPDRPALASQAMNLEGVVAVRELMTGKRNVHIMAVAAEGEEITSIANQLTEMGLSIESEELVKNDFVQPFSKFGIGSIDQ